MTATPRHHEFIALFVIILYIAFGIYEIFNNPYTQLIDMVLYIVIGCGCAVALFHNIYR